MEVSGQLHDRSLYPQGKSPQYPLDRRLGGPQSRSGHGASQFFSFLRPIIPRRGSRNFLGGIDNSATLRNVREMLCVNN
jgi:hypothetical protein